MNDRSLLAALLQLHRAAQLLHRTIQTILPQIADALHIPNGTPARSARRQTMVRSHLDELVEPTRQVLGALHDIHRALATHPAQLPNQQPAAPSVCPPPGIDFQSFQKLREPLFPEKALEVFAPLRGQPHLVLLRLEALRSPEVPGYEVVVSRQETVCLHPPVRQAGSPADPPHTANVWVGYDTIHSDRPTADQALEQVLNFLEMRCN